MKRILLSLIAVFLSVLSLSAQKIVAHESVAEKGYRFWLHSPVTIANLPDSLRQPKPLIVFLHGASLCGNKLSKVLNYGPLDAVRRGREINAYIVAPQTQRGPWDPKKIMDIVEWVEKNELVDSNRIYVIGMSLGGFGTFAFTATYPNRVAAAIAMCGGGSTIDQSGLLEVPLWILHGTADGVVPISRSNAVVADMKRKGEPTRLIYTKLRGANHSDPARVFYMEKTYEWLFKHRLSDEGRPVNTEYTIDMTDIRKGYQNLTRREASTVPIINEVEVVQKKQAASKTKAQAQPDVTDASGAVYHTIQQGDNLWLLARRYGTTVKKLTELNGIDEKKTLQLGKKLRIK